MGYQELERESSRNAMIQSQIIRPPLKPLPVEILLLIFEHTLENVWYANPGLWNGPQSTWCQNMRTKNALNHVCSAWYGAASEFLYKDVVLRRIGQVAALARTLQTSGGTRLGPLIRNLSVTCAVEKSWIRAFNVDISSVLRNAPLIHSLTLKPCLPLPCTFGLMQGAITTSITSLHYIICCPNYLDLGFLLRACTKLTDLRLQGQDFTNTTQPHQHEQWTSEMLQNISLPSLKSLRLEVTSRNKDLLPTIQNTWILNSLESLAVVFPREFRFKSWIWDALMGIVERHSAKLKYLQMHLAPPEHFDNLDSLLAHMPLLEHLVLALGSVPHTPAIHTRLKWIDVIYFGEELQPEKLGWCFAKAKLPALQGVRYLRVQSTPTMEGHHSLEGGEGLVELPLRFPPLPPSTASYVHEFEIADSLFNPTTIAWDSDLEDDSDYEPDPYGSIDSDLGIFPTVSDCASSDEEDSDSLWSDESSKEEEDTRIDADLSAISADVFAGERGSELSSFSTDNESNRMKFYHSAYLFRIPLPFGFLLALPPALSAFSIFLFRCFFVSAVLAAFVS